MARRSKKSNSNLCKDPAIIKGDLIFFTDRSKHTSHVALCHKTEIQDDTTVPWIIHAAYGKNTCEVTEGPLKKYEGVEYIVVRPRAKVLGQNVIDKMIEIAQNWLTTPFDTNRYEAYTEYCEQTKPFTTEQAGNEFKKNKKEFNKNKGYYRAIKFAARYLKNENQAIYDPDNSKGFICFHFIISLIQTAIVLEEFGYAFNQKVCSGAWPSRKKINLDAYVEVSSSAKRFTTLTPDYIKTLTSDCIDNNTQTQWDKDALPAPCFIHSDNLDAINAIQKRLNKLIGIDALAHMTPLSLLLHLTEFDPNGPAGGANSSGPFRFVKHINPSAKRKNRPARRQSRHTREPTLASTASAQEQALGACPFELSPDPAVRLAMKHIQQVRMSRKIKKQLYRLFSRNKRELNKQLHRLFSRERNEHEQRPAKRAKTNVCRG